MRTRNARDWRPLVAALAAVALLVALPGAVPAAAGEEASAAGPPGEWASEWVVPGSVIVTTRDTASTSRFGREGPAWLASRGVRARGVSEIAARVSVVEVPAGSEAAAAEALRGRPGVASVEPDYRSLFQRTPDDSRYADQWAHAQTGIEAGWERSTGAVGVKVALLDSGVDGRHPDLAGNLVAQVSTVTGNPGNDGTAGVPKDNATCPVDTPGYDHGTAVAGVAGAVGNNGEGVAGAAWRIGIVDVQVAGGSSCQGPTTAAVIRGLDFVARYHADVAAVNMSFGFPAPHCPTGLQSAINTLRASGVTVVAASGNDYGYDRMMPAGCQGVIAIGASRGDRGLASYSSRQRYVDLVAPGGELGEGVLTTIRRPAGGGTEFGYATRAGTSFAAPYVTGVVALVQELRQRRHGARLSPNEVESLLEVTARHPDGSGRHDPRFGWGLLHAGDALHRADWTRPRLPVPPRPHPLIRFAAGSTTEPITQAIAVSRAMFDRREAQHVLIARSDDYADALAGSGLGFGVGPILFTPPGRPLDSRVRAEIQRVLAPGGRVYVLGGTQAVDVSVEDEIANLGFSHRRLSGPVREDTAAAISAEVLERVKELGFPVHSDVVVATRGNWPDAVAAGSLAATYGLPVLLTPVNSLHPASRDALSALDPSRVYVVGGTAAVSTATATAIGQAAGVSPRRLSGPARDETAIAVGGELQRRLALANLTPPLTVAVNLDRPDAYAHTLAATVIAGLTGSVFVPVRWTQQSGARVTDAVASYACGVPGPGGTDPGGGIDVVLAGGPDLLPAAVGRELQDLYDRPSTAC